jgi:hypothetical protein
MMRRADITRGANRAGKARLAKWAAGAFAVACAWVVAPVALAAPIIDYTVEGTSQPITGLFAGSSGSMWFIQQISETGEDTTSQFRLGRIDDTGSITTFPPQTGRAPFTEGAPDGVGGAWALRAETSTSPSQSSGGLTHLNADGTVENVPMPRGLLPEAIKLGADGNAWLLGCSGMPSSGEQSCSAYSVSSAGAVNSYPLTSIAHDLPTHAYYAEDTIMPVSDGIWMNPSHTSPGHVAFVSYSGAVTVVPLEVGLELVGPGPGDDVWWQRAEAGLITVGLLSPTGEVSAEQTRAAESSAPNADFMQAGPEGNLLWSDSTPWNENQTGEVGTYTASGKTEYVVPSWAASVPQGEDFWTGACTFGTQLHEASDGGLWIVSTGHPDVVSYESPAGAFSTFMPLPPPVPKELGIEAMQESTTGGLWFALYTESGQTMLARADSLSPPAGLSPYPGTGNTSYPPERQQGAATTPLGGDRAALVRALATARISIAGLWGRHHTGYVKVVLPVAGHVQVAVSIHARGHQLVIATGRATRTSPGLAAIAIRPTHLGRALARERTHRVTVMMTFTSSSGILVREARSLKP